MDLIILQDGLYHLIPVTKELFVGVARPEVVDCFSLCDIAKEKLTTYLDHINKHVMKEGGGFFFGCICN